MARFYIEEFAQMLPEICEKDTSADPQRWIPKNPLWGHCAVVALLAQDHFGGIILRSSLEHVHEWAFMRAHYQSLLAIGPIDFTAGQFGGNYPNPLGWEERKREDILANDRTRERYELLEARSVLYLRRKKQEDLKKPD